MSGVSNVDCSLLKRLWKHYSRATKNYNFARDGQFVLYSLEWFYGFVMPFVKFSVLSAFVAVSTSSSVNVFGTLLCAIRLI